MNGRLRLFVCVYGREFTDLFQQVICRSLLQPRNLRALRTHAVTVSLYSDAPSMLRASEIAGCLGEVEPHVIERDGNDAQIQQSAIMQEIRRCIDTDSTFVLVCPDNYWGDGSLPNMVATAGTAKGICVAVPFPRVAKGQFLATLPPGRYVDNAGLVWLALKTLHPSWRQAFSDQERTSSFAAGISITKLSDTLYTVSHLMPTVFLARFIEEDYTFFREAIEKGLLGIFDLWWPSLLVRQGRQRVIGSSDLAFMVELTDTGSHNVKLTPQDPAGLNPYCREVFHTSVNRNVKAVWRSV